MIKIILLQDVPQLGQKDEIRSVRFGFAKNWLIPLKLAALATPAVVSRIEKQKTLQEEQVKREAQTYKERMKELEGFTLRLRPKKTKKATLYAAIDADAIAQHLAKKGMNIDVKHIHLEKPIKKAGEYDIPIIFSKDSKASIKVIVQ